MNKYKAMLFALILLPILANAADRPPLPSRGPLVLPIVEMREKLICQTYSDTMEYFIIGKAPYILSGIHTVENRKWKVTKIGVKKNGSFVYLKNKEGITKVLNFSNGWPCKMERYIGN